MMPVPPLKDRPFVLRHIIIDFKPASLEELSAFSLTEPRFSGLAMTMAMTMCHVQGACAGAAGSIMPLCCR